MSSGLDDRSVNGIRVAWRFGGLDFAFFASAVVGRLDWSYILSNVG